MRANNHIAEWFGYRVYPGVACTSESVRDQRDGRCPFLSSVKDEEQSCIKGPNSRGVCTVSSTSNGPRQDWVVCPYRVLSPTLVEPIARRLFGVAEASQVRTHAAPTLAEPEVQARVPVELAAGDRVLIYFDEKLGGEISLRSTERSPEVSFDVTFVELKRAGEELVLGKFGIVEMQTMDFHGSYRHAVTKLMHAVSLFPDDYPAELAKHPEWTCDRVEGPNIANVVKRTFWQMFFKFEFAKSEHCAGTALAIPIAVWDSWQPFLGKPELIPAADGTYRLAVEPAVPEDMPSAWIYVFDIDADSAVAPNPIVIQKVIGVLPGALEYFALTEAPRHASESLTAEAGIYVTLRRRIRAFWRGQSIALPKL